MDRVSGTETAAGISSRRAIVAGVVCSAAFLAIVLAHTDLHDAWRALRQLHPRLVWPPFVIACVGLAIRAWRWHVIFPPAVRPRLARCAAVWLIANMSNNVLPARGGDLVRCLLIARGRAEETSTGLATLALEKVLDGLAVVSVVAVSFFVLDPPPWLWWAGGFGAVLFGGALAAIFVFNSEPERIQRVVQSAFARIRRPAIGAKLSRLAESCALGFSAIRSPRHMLVLLLMTALTWIPEATLVWAIARALSLPVTFWGGALVAAVLGLGLTVPAGPGYVGTYEFFSVAALALLGVDSDGALALTLAMHACVLVVTTSLGLVSLAATGLSFSRLLVLRRHPETPHAEG